MFHSWAGLISCLSISMGWIVGGTTFLGMDEEGEAIVVSSERR